MLNKEQLKNLQNQLDKIASLENDMGIGAVNSARFISDFYTFINNIKSILGNNEISEKEKNIFNNLIVNKYIWKSIPKPGSMPTGEDVRKLNELKMVLGNIVAMSSNLDPNKKEWNFSIKDSYKAKKFILELLKKATNSIRVIDNYLDEEIFDYLDGIDDNLDIMLITDGQKKIFQNLYKSYIIDRPKTQAKINNQSHDRFIIIDDQELFALGASLNTIGKKDFMIHKIENEEEKIKKLQDFNDYWNNGNKIIT